MIRTKCEICGRAMLKNEYRELDICNDCEESQYAGEEAIMHLER